MVSFYLEHMGAHEGEEILARRTRGPGLALVL